MPNEPRNVKSEAEIIRPGLLAALEKGPATASDLRQRMGVAPSTSRLNAILRHMMHHGAVRIRGRKRNPKSGTPSFIWELALTPEDILSTDYPRWTPLRKLTLLQAIEAGNLTDESASKQYGVTREEIYSWRARYQLYGEIGLKTTRAQLGRGHKNSARGVSE